MRFSICICTYNRASILPFCLESLTHLTIPGGIEAEILVVDNNSSDNTKEVVDHYSRASPVPIFYFREAHQGLSAARNRAIREASGDYFAFLDDECTVKPDWLQFVVADVVDVAPLIIGGPYVGAYLPKSIPPKWFKTEYGNAYFLNRHFTRGFQKDFRASGGNMIVHRNVCKLVQFDQAFGVTANELKLGEEIVFQERFLAKNPGLMVFYEPRIEIAHYILPQKMSLLYLMKRLMESGALQCNMRYRDIPVKVAQVFIQLAVYPFRMALRDRSAYPYWQNYAYEVAIPRVAPNIGAALEKFRKRYQ